MSDEFNTTEVEGPQERIFSHSGDAGDFIASLPTVRQLGGGRINLFPHECTEHRMTRELADSLRPMLLAQEFITGVEWSESCKGTDLNQWRGRYDNWLNLADMVANTFSVPHWSRNEPWLKVRPRRIAPVVFHRSPRYRNWAILPVWKRAWLKYHKQAVFVGTSEEHADFIHFIGPVPRYPTKDYLELAEVINGCSLYMGNQSSPFWIAEAMKKTLILETHPGHPNCHFERAGHIHSRDSETVVPDLWRVGLRTLLTEDRQATIERSVRETAHLPGDMAELGVLRGGVSLMMTSTAPLKRHHLFDTFTSAPSDAPFELGHNTGEFCVLRAEVEDYLKGQKILIHEGLFPDSTIGLDDLRFTCVHLDGESYETTAAGLDYFLQRMVEGGVVVLDDVDHWQTPGVNRALEERGLMGRVERIAKLQGRIQC